MRKRQSVKKLLIRLFCLMIFITLLGFSVCGGYSLFSMQRELSYCNEAALDVFYQGLQFTADDLESFSGLIYDKDPLFGSLGRQSISIDNRLAAEMNLRQLCRSRTTASTGVYLFEQDGGFSYYCYGDAFLGGHLTPAFVKTLAEVRALWTDRDPVSMDRWTVYASDGTALLTHAVRRDGLYACVMIDLNAYAQTHQPDAGSSGIAFAFFDSERVLTNADYVQASGLTLADIQSTVGGSRRAVESTQMLHSRYSEELNVGLCGMIPMTGVWASLRFYSVLLIVALAVIAIIFWVIYTLMNRMLIYPLDRISLASRRLASGATEIERQSEPIVELDAIQDALGGLVDQKVSLERESLSQTYQKEHALLQYYQLQMRSHFFLNCLKSIYNMTSRGETDKTLRVITLFSNHLRYVFHDSLSLMPVRAELAEVEDYFHIIEFERSDHILLTQEVDPELLDFPVPPLIIQTFLENFNKHNALSDRILRFVIRIDRVEMEGRSYVRLRLSDNGVGYDREALKTMEQQDGLFAQYHVGIQNLRRRLDILYQNDYQIAFYNNPGGGACSVIYLPWTGPAAENEKEQEGENE